jgi:hypothetical protein
VHLDDRPLSGPGAAAPGQLGAVDPDDGCADVLDEQGVALDDDVELPLREVRAGERAAVDRLAGAYLEEVDEGGASFDFPGMKWMASFGSKRATSPTRSGWWALQARKRAGTRRVYWAGEEGSSGAVGTVVLPVPGMGAPGYERRERVVQGR